MDSLKILIVGLTAARMTDTPEETEQLLEETLRVLRKRKGNLEGMFTVVQEDENERIKANGGEQS